MSGMALETPGACGRLIVTLRGPHMVQLGDGQLNGKEVSHMVQLGDGQLDGK